MRIVENGKSGLRKRRQRGSELIEFTLVFLPFLGFMALLLNIAWAVYTQATIQYAVAQGVRFAVTSQANTAAGMGMTATIQTYVQQNAFGRLNGTSGVATGTNGWNHINVDWYTINSTGGLVLEDGLTGATETAVFAQLPLVRVSVISLPGMFLVPFVKMPGLATLSPITASAYAWDRMEAPPLTGTPAM